MIDILPYSSTRYQPQENDTVIGIITGKNPEFFTVDIGADSMAQLAALQFQNATRKEQPRYPDGTLIYCRVLSNDRYGKTQLSCINPLEKKAWNSGEAFFQDLKGGLVKELPIFFCRQQLLSSKTDYLLERLGQIFEFEMCTGYNGKVWVKAQRTIDVIMIFNSMQRVVDRVIELRLNTANIYQTPEIQSLVDQILQPLLKKK